MELVRDRVASGRYQSASEVIREGLRLLEQRDQREQVFWSGVRKKVAEGQAELAAGRGIPGDVARAGITQFMRHKRAQAKRRP